MIKGPPLVALAVLASAVFLAPACILDFDGLAGGGGSGGSAASGSSAMSGSSAASGGGSSTVSSSGAGGGSSDACATAAVLDCSACPTDCPAVGCKPVTLATGNPAAAIPIGLAAADDTLYWANQESGTIARIVGKGAPETIAMTTKPVAIAAAAGRVVWTAEDGLWGCPANTCDADKKQLATSIGPGTIQGVAFDGAVVFWTDRGTDSNNGNGEVRRCTFDACADVVDIATGQIFPQGITLSADSVFWVAQATGDMNGTVTKAPRTGGASKLITAALDLPTAVVADATYVYWTQSTQQGKVYRCLHNQGYCDIPEDIAPQSAAFSQPLDIAIGGGRVYFSTAGDGKILSCPLGGCGASQPSVHASMGQGLHRIAVATSCLLWTDDTGGGSVFKVAR